MSTPDPTSDQQAPHVPRPADEQVQPVLTTAKAIGITVAVVLAVFGLLAVAFLLFATVVLNTSGSNK